MTNPARLRTRMWDRQMRLAEIGPSGQAALQSAVVCLRTEGTAGLCERRYVERAGMHVAPVDPKPVSADTCSLGFRFAAAEEIAAAALSALASLHTSLAERNGAEGS